MSNSRVSTGWAYLPLQIGVRRWECLIDHPVKVDQGGGVRNLAMGSG